MAKARKPSPACPRPGHAGSKTVADGYYGKAGHRRQRYRCVPANGERWHRFVPPLPRQEVPGGHCETCERAVQPHEGPPTPRWSLFSAQEIALALIALGRGATYRGAAAAMREHAGRFPVGKKGTRYTRHGQLAADMVELFAPVVFAPDAPTAWPAKTLVLDQIPFRVRDFYPNGRPKPGGTVAFNVFGALGYDAAGRGFVWRLEAFHTANADDWEQFLRALPGAPKRVVCDAHDGIGAAVRRVFPAADLYLCEWHLREKLCLRLTRAKANTPAELAWRRLEQACHSDHGWEQFKAAVYRRRPVLAEVRRWIERWDETVLAQFARRPSAAERDRGVVVTTGGIEIKLRAVQGCLESRRFVLGNRQRLNRLLMLIQLELNDHANQAAYAREIRAWLEARDGHAPARRAIADPPGSRSLRR